MNNMNRININEFVGNFGITARNCYRDLLNGNIPMEDKSSALTTIKARLQRDFTSNRINDSNFDLVSISMSGETMGVEATSTSTYVDKFSKKIYTEAEKEKNRQKQAENLESDDRDYEDVKQTRDGESKPQEKKTIRFTMNMNDFMGLSDVDLKAALLRFLRNNDLEEYASKPIKEIHHESPELKQVGLGVVTLDGTLLDVLIYEVRLEEKMLAQSNDGKAPKPKKLDGEGSPVEESTPNQETPTQPKSKFVGYSKEEEEEDRRKIGENSRDINFFVGYDEAQLNRLLAGKQDLEDALEDFVRRYNEIMNKLTFSSPEEINFDDIRNDINPQMQTMQVISSKYGADGALVQNLCDGMKSVIDSTIEAKERGEHINPIAMKQDMANRKTFDLTDDDGLRHSNGNQVRQDNENESLTGTIDNIVGSPGLDAGPSIHDLDAICYRELGMSYEEADQNFVFESIQSPNDLIEAIEEIRNMGLDAGAMALTRHTDDSTP